MFLLGFRLELDPLCGGPFALLENETVDSYALKSNVSRNTVRTHLASLFAKTGSKRQAELLRTLQASQPHVTSQATGPA